MLGEIVPTWSPTWSFSPGKGVATAAADHLPLQRGQTTLEVKTRSDGVAVVCRCFGSMVFL